MASSVCVERVLRDSSVSVDGGADVLSVGVSSGVGGLELVLASVKRVWVVVGVSGLNLSLNWNFDGGLNGDLIEVVVGLGSFDWDDVDSETSVWGISVNWLSGDLVVHDAGNFSCNLSWHKVVDGDCDLSGDLLWNLVINSDNFGIIDGSGVWDPDVVGLLAEHLDGGGAGVSRVVVGGGAWVPGVAGFVIGGGFTVVSVSGVGAGGITLFEKVGSGSWLLDHLDDGSWDLDFLFSLLGDDDGINTGLVLSSWDALKDGVIDGVGDGSGDL